MNLFAINHLQKIPSKSVSSDLKKLYFRPFGKYLLAYNIIYLIATLFIIVISLIIMFSFLITRMLGIVIDISEGKNIIIFIFLSIFIVANIITAIIPVILINNDKVISFQSIKYAWEIFKRRPLVLFLMRLLWFSIIFVSIIPLEIGLFWSLPAFYIYHIKPYQIAVSKNTNNKQLTTD